MPRTPELEQQLWELVYELLPENEAAALRQRISSEPEVARAYAEVKLQTEILAQAAKSELPLPVLQHPVSDDAAWRDETATRPSVAAAGPPTPGWSTAARAANWLLGLATALLVGLLGYSAFESQFPFASTTASQSASAGGRMRTLVFAAPRVPSNRDGDLLVLTQSDNGQPRAEELRCRLYAGNAQAPVVDKSAATDDAGVLQIKLPVLPVSSKLRLELVSRGDLAAPPLRADLAFAADPLTTLLTLDRPVYQPGDQIRYRSLTLPPFADELADEVAVEFSLRDPHGVQIPGVANYAVSTQGIAHGQLQVPVAAGDDSSAVVTEPYTLVARSPSRQYPEASLDFRIDEPAVETATEAIPPEAGRIAVEFFPESGSLVSGVLNRVYFAARAASGDAASIQGRIVDRSGKPVVSVQSGQAGRGRFVFTPLEDESYRLEFDASAGRSELCRLPTAAAERFITLAADPGVLDAGQSLHLELRSTQCTRPLAVVTRCRGATVGQTLVSSKDFPDAHDEVGICRLDLPLDERADGVIRVTLVDLSVRPPHPVAERLVFRRPARKLNIQVAASDRAGAPDGQVELAVAVSDEQQRPQTATLGISVVPVDAAERAEDRLPSLTTQYWLTSSLDGASLPNADDYLREEPEAAVALDLLLGAQRPRWSVVNPPGQLAQSGPHVESEGRLRPTSDVTLDPEAAGLACLAEQLSNVTAPSAREVAASQAARELHRERLGRALFLGSLVVLIGLITVGLLRLSVGVKIWAPVLSAATVCLLMGGLWMGRPSGSPAPIDTEPQLAKVELSQRLDDPAVPLPAEAPLPSEAIADADRPAENAKPYAPQSIRYFDADKSLTPPSDRKTDSYAEAAPGPRADRAEGGMSAGLSAKPEAGGVELDATPSRPALQALPGAAAPSAESFAAPAPVPAAPAPVPAAPARTAMPVAAAPDVPSLAATGPRLESASGAAAKDATAAEAQKRRGLEREATAPASEPSPPADHLAASDRFEKSDSAARGGDVARKSGVAGMKSAGRRVQGFGMAGGGMGGGMAADAHEEVARELHRDAGKLAEKEAGGEGLGGLGDQPSPVAGGLGGAMDLRARSLADARSMSAKEQVHDPAAEKLKKSAADKTELSLAETPRAATSETGPGIDWVERSNEPLYWEPKLPTDAAGRARLRFSLPSNVSAYRVSIDAHAQGRIGHVQERFHSPAP